MINKVRIVAIIGLMAVLSSFSFAQTCGDINSDGRINMIDPVHILMYAFYDGPAPDPLWIGDVNGDGAVNIADFQYAWRNILDGDIPPYDCLETGSVPGPDLPGQFAKSSGDFVDIDIVLNGKNIPVTKLYMGYEYEIRVKLENSIDLRAFSVGFKTWADAGVVWDWVDQPDNFLRAPFVTVEPGCRFDDAGFPVGLRTAQWGNQNTDPVSLGATDIFASIAAGDLEHMFSLHFMITDIQDNLPHAMCVDTSGFGHYDGDMVFVDLYAAGVYPTQLWPDGGLCLPILKYMCGDSNHDGEVDLGDVVFTVNYVFKGGPAPSPYCVADANGDDVVNIGDAVFIINYVFKNGLEPGGCCL